MSNSDWAEPIRSCFGIIVKTAESFTTQSMKRTPKTPRAIRAYVDNYSTPGLWAKLRRVARRAGYEMLEKALWLYYAAQRPETPAWARTTAYGALGYLILPTDTIPDWLFAAGYTDDLGVLTLAVATLVNYIDDDVRRRTARRLQRWFGAQPESAGAAGQSGA